MKTSFLGRTHVIIGLSGGGYTAFCHYLLSNSSVTSYQSWVGISDLESWYYKSLSQKDTFREDILACTESKDNLNIYKARKRSPLHMPLSKSKSTTTVFNIYTGVYDGFQGSVPITHSINFYNKIKGEVYGDESNYIVTQEEILHLLENRTPLGQYGSIGERNLFLEKKSPRTNLFVFEGNHEILSKFSIEHILQNN